jgi:hypothetical protein
MLSTIDIEPLRHLFALHFVSDEAKKIIGGANNYSNFLNIFFTRTFFDRDTAHLCSRFTNNGFSHLAGSADT